MPKLENHSKVDVERDLLPFEEISFITSEPQHFPELVDIVIPVSHKDEAIAFVLIGDIEAEGDLSGRSGQTPLPEVWENLPQVDLGVAHQDLPEGDIGLDGPQIPVLRPRLQNEVPAPAIDIEQGRIVINPGHDVDVLINQNPGFGDGTGGQEQ